MRNLLMVLALAAMVLLAGCPKKDGKTTQKVKPAATSQTPRADATTAPPKVTGQIVAPAATTEPPKTGGPATTPPTQTGPTVAPPAKQVVTIELETCKLTNCQAKDYAKASAGKAVLFDKDSGKAETTVELPAGKYKVVAVGMAPDGQQDALSLVIEGVDRAQGVRAVNERICFDQEFNAFGDCSTPEDATLELTMPAKGNVKLSLEITDEAGMAVDCVKFEPVK